MYFAGELILWKKNNCVHADLTQSSHSAQWNQGKTSFDFSDQARMFEHPELKVRSELTRSSLIIHPYLCSQIHLLKINYIQGFHTERQYFDLNPQKLRQLWHVAMVRALLKVSNLLFNWSDSLCFRSTNCSYLSFHAKSVIQSKAKVMCSTLPSIERIVYSQCEKEARTLVQLARYFLFWVVIYWLHYILFFQLSYLFDLSQMHQSPNERERSNWSRAKESENKSMHLLYPQAVEFEEKFNAGPCIKFFLIPLLSIIPFFTPIPTCTTHRSVHWEPWYHFLNPIF